MEDLCLVPTALLAVIANEQLRRNTELTLVFTYQRNLLAQKYIVELVEDLTNEPIEDGAGEPVHFSLDGVSYTIDLSTKHADEFRSSFTHYVNAARKAGAVTAGKSRSTRSSSSTSSH